MSAERAPFQRNGETDPTGKLSVRFDMHVSEQMEADMAMRAALERIPKAEYVRRLIERDLYGSINLMRRIVAGNTE